MRYTNASDCDLSRKSFGNRRCGSTREQWAERSPRSHPHDAEASEHSVLVMLERAAGWRWQHSRDDSPRHPSPRLFRQQCDGDWAGAVAAIADALRRRMVAL